MRGIALGAAVCGALLVPSAAFAGPPAAGAAASEQPAARTLYICEDSSLTRRAMLRLQGEAKFMTARQVRASTGWHGVRCITKAEFRKLNALASIAPR